MASGRGGDFRVRHGQRLIAALERIDGAVLADQGEVHGERRAMEVVALTNVSASRLREKRKGTRSRVPSRRASGVPLRPRCRAGSRPKSTPGIAGARGSSFWATRGCGGCGGWSRAATTAPAARSFCVRSRTFRRWRTHSTGDGHFHLDVARLSLFAGRPVAEGVVVAQIAAHGLELRGELLVDLEVETAGALGHLPRQPRPRSARRRRSSFRGGSPVVPRLRRRWDRRSARRRGSCRRSRAAR